MTIYTPDDLHINHQLTLPPTGNFQNQRNRRLNLSQQEFDRFNPNLQEYLNQTNTKQSREVVIEWVKTQSPIAAITMVFNCAISHRDSVDLLNRFYDCLCKYQYGRTYKKRSDLVSMFAFLENAVKDAILNTKMRITSIWFSVTQIAFSMTMIQLQLMYQMPESKPMVIFKKPSKLKCQMHHMCLR